MHGLLIIYQALEEGEDIQELSERARDKKERRATNKLVRQAESIGSPVPEFESPRPRKSNKKGKAKAELEVPASSKRKRGGGKSTSMTPSIIEEDDDERDAVCGLHCLTSSVS